MENEKNQSIHRSTYSVYNSYTSSKGDNKSKFESKNNFRKGLSMYDMNSNSITCGDDCKWDRRNCSGIPVDFDNVKKTVFVDGSDSHSIVIGATGSKKSRLIVMPTVRTLAACGENMIICDPKGEMFKRTAGFLKSSGYNVNMINLREPQKGDGWNMLKIPYELYLKGEIDKSCEFVNDATINLIPITSNDPYWDFSSRDLLFGLIMLLFRICKDKNLSEDNVNMFNVIRLKEELFSSTDTSSIRRKALWKYAEQDDIVRMRLNGTIICPEKTMSCIISTLDQHLSIFTLQPQVTEMLSSSTFDLNNVGFNKNVIFLIMPDEKSTFHKIITIFVKQIYEFLIESAFKKTSDNRFPFRINFILDEFSSLPVVNDFPQMVTASRSRNIRFVLIVQSKHQLRQRYQDETDTIMSNCGNWLFLTSREVELLQEISILSGKSGTKGEALIDVSRLQHLNKDEGECLIFSGRKYPYIARLPDIDVYDSGQYEKYEMESRNNTQKAQELGFFEKIVKEKEPQISDSADTDISDIQKELEAKLDELFGDSDDSDKN